MGQKAGHNLQSRITAFTICTAFLPSLTAVRSRKYNMDDHGVQSLFLAGPLLCQTN